MYRLEDEPLSVPVSFYLGLVPPHCLPLGHFSSLDLPVKHPLSVTQNNYKEKTGVWPDVGWTPGFVAYCLSDPEPEAIFFHLELGIITPTSSGCEEDWGKYSQCLASKSGISVSGQLPSCATLVNNAAPFRKRQFTSLGC